MKRTGLVAVIGGIIFVFSIFSLFSLGKCKAEEIELSPNFDLRENFLRSENLHTIYSLGSRGVKTITGDKTTLAARTGQVLLNLPLVVYSSLLGHEGGHELVFKESGAEHTWIEIRPSGGYCGAFKPGGFTKKERVRAASAGLDWNNKAADETVGRNLGQKVDISEILWFGINQLNFPRYFFSKRYGPHSDINNWISYLSDDKPIADRLESDIKLGAIWQSLGGVVPFYSGLKYIQTGEKPSAPRWWLNPQTDLTDAGVMYRLGGWFKDEEYVFMTQLGWGKNRLENKNMFLFEVGAETPIPILSARGGVKVGYSQTANTNFSWGLFLKKSLNKKLAVGMEVNHYGGYHRNNPRAEGNWKEAVLAIRVFI